MVGVLFIHCIQIFSTVVRIEFVFVSIFRSELSFMQCCFYIRYQTVMFY